MSRPAKTLGHLLLNLKSGPTTEQGKAFLWCLGAGEQLIRWGILAPTKQAPRLTGNGWRVFHELDSQCEAHVS